MLLSDTVPCTTLRSCRANGHSIAHRAQNSYLLILGQPSYNLQLTGENNNNNTHKGISQLWMISNRPLLHDRTV